MSSILQFHLRMRAASIALSLGKLITVTYIVATIVWIYPTDPDRGFPHLLFAWILGGICTIGVTYAASRRLIDIRFRFDREYWREILVKALPYGLALVLGTMYFRTGTIALSLFHRQDQVGYYGVPLRFLEILQIIPHYFMNSVLPVLTISLQTEGEHASRLVRYAISSLTALSFPILAGGMVLAWPLTAAVSSPDFLSHRLATGELMYGSDFALKILLVAMTFTYLHVGMSYALVAMGRQKEILWANAIAVVVNIILNVILSPKFGFIGAASASAVTELTMFVLLALRLSKRMHNFIDVSFLSKTALSAIIMGAVLMMVAEPLNVMLYTKSLFVLVPLGAVIFAAGLFFTKAVTKEMVALIMKKSEPPSETPERLL